MKKVLIGLSVPDQSRDVFLLSLNCLCGFFMIFEYKMWKIFFGDYYRPSMKLREGNVFTHVCLSVHRRWGEWDVYGHYSWCMDLTVQNSCGPGSSGHWISLYRDPLAPATLQTLDINVQGPPGPLLVSSGGHPLRPVKTCSLEDPSTLVLTSGDYGST